MNTYELLIDVQKELEPETVTKAVDIGNGCVVCVCLDNGTYPLHMPYFVDLAGNISSYNMNKSKNREKFNNGNVVYEDDTMLRKNPARSDGGPGSGNWGHEGRPEQQGGSAPGGGNENRHETENGKFASPQKIVDAYNSYAHGEKSLSPKDIVKGTMTSLGYSEDTYEASSKLLDSHTFGGESQAKADSEIYEHINSQDTIGRYFSDKATMEEQAWQEECEDAKARAEKNYIDDLKEYREFVDRHPDYTKKDLAMSGIFEPEPEEYPYFEPKFYRKGDMDKDVLSFSKNEAGANMSPITSGEYGSIGSDVSYTLSEMKSMGYRPIAGIVGMDVGYSGESEVLFAKFPSNSDSRTDGGPGSGNHGHAGVPGSIGGSAPQGSSSAEANERFAQKMADEKKELMGKKDNQKAMTLMHKGFLTRQEALDAWHSGVIDEKIDEYYNIMEQNGNTESEKLTTTENNDNAADNDVRAGKYDDHIEAQKDYIKEETGLSDEECDSIYNEMEKWMSGALDAANSEQLDKYIENDHTYEGEIYRGLAFGDAEEGGYDAFMKDLKPGSVIGVGESEGRNASWTSEPEVARKFSDQSSQWSDSVIIKCVENRTASPIAKLSGMGEREVLSHSRAQWTVLNVEESEKNEGGRRAVVTVVENGTYRSETSNDSKYDEQDESSEDLEPVSLQERWKESSKDFVVLSSSESKADNLDERQVGPYKDAFLSLPDKDAEYLAGMLGTSVKAIDSGSEETLKELYELVCGEIDWGES